jgi:nucleoside-diphosphate-sugar epimerase
MKILIIGNGFLGAAIEEKLYREGHEILFFARTRSAKVESRQVLGTVFNYEEFVKVFDWKPQVVIHTAWITTPGVYRDHSSNIQYAEFTSKLAKTVSNSDIEHLIILGTCAEYGRQVKPSTAGQTKISPSTLYAQQKVVAFDSAQQLLKESNVRLTWARVFYPYGLNQDRNRLIPRIIHSIEEGNQIVLADTSSVYDWITTRDIASAISWVLEHELPTEIDIGTSNGFTNLELLIALENLLATANQTLSQSHHDYGLNEVFVAGENSPLFMSGWSPRDTLDSGLEWVLGHEKT